LRRFVEQFAMGQMDQIFAGIDLAMGRYVLTSNADFKEVSTTE